MKRRDPRRHVVRGFPLECGETVSEIVHAFHLDGALNEARDNAVVVFHALPGNADAAGTWWRALIGPGRAIDTDRYAVLCTNLLGSCYGTQGPWTAAGRPAPPLTPRDQARLVARLADELGIGSVALAVGGGLGGMVALEWIADAPERTRAGVALAAPAAQTALGIGWNHVQRAALELDGARGLELAHQVAMLTHRGGGALEARFGGAPGERGGFAVGEWLERYGSALRARFTADTYRALTGAMDAHDVGRGRGGIAAALAPFRGRLTGVGIPGDLFYPADEVRKWTDEVGAEYREILSPHGHDGFLLEPERVGALLREALEGAAPVASGGIHESGERK